MIKVYGNSNKFIDHFFWIILILYTNPGGILSIFIKDSNGGGVDISDFMFVTLGACFLLVYQTKDLLSDKYFIGFLKSLIIFLLYYLIVFGFFIPKFKNSVGYSASEAFIKMRYAVFNILIIIFVFTFFLRSYRLFFKYFIFSSIVIITLFLITVVLGVDILPVKTLDRRFINISRLIMESYGLMPILIPIGVVILIFRFKIKYRNIALIASLLMFMAWLLSLLRREIFGTILLFFLAAIINNYLYKKNLIPVKKVLQSIFYLIIVVFILKVTFPKYVEAGEQGAMEAYHVFKYGETMSGKKDVRLGFGKVEMQEKIRNNYIVGTGFDNRWRVSEEAGFEASDYPLLAAIAMVGIVGLLFFLPIYIMIFKSIKADLLYLREHRFTKDTYDVFFLVLFTIYLIYDFINYTYWFLPVSLFTHAGHKKWYILLGLYIASRKVFYYNQKTIYEHNTTNFNQ